MAEAANQQPGDSIHWAQWEQQFEGETQQIPLAERCLTEIDHLNAHRMPDGTIPQWVRDEVRKNLYSMVQEGAMPSAVTKTEHNYEEVDTDERGEAVHAFTWLGRTAVSHAMSGYRYHRHPEALKRVAVEVDEAEYVEKNLRPGMTKIFISPRMTEKEASHEDAVKEHLADEDSLRGYTPITDEHGAIYKRELQSLLIRNIPLSAWLAMLQDENNIFGRAIKVKDDGRALSVMEAHEALEVPTDRLPEGIVTIIAALIPYIPDEATREDVAHQLVELRQNQADKSAKAMNMAKRWEDVEVELADSLYNERATPFVGNFINSMQSHWNDEALEVILAHQLPNGEYRMSRELTAIVEMAKQNILLTRAAVVTDNAKVLKQLKPAEARQIYSDEMSLQAALVQGDMLAIRAIEARSDQHIAAQNVTNSGGCAGVVKGAFNSKAPDGSEGSFTTDQIEVNDNPTLDLIAKSKNRSRTGKIKKGVCVVQSCPTRPGETKVGACNICIDRCQRMFDNGKDPTRLPPAQPRKTQELPKEQTEKPKQPAYKRLIERKRGEHGSDSKAEKSRVRTRQKLGRQALQPAAA